MPRHEFILKGRAQGRQLQHLMYDLEKESAILRGGDDRSCRGIDQ
jgi:hypothetical protein